MFTMDFRREGSVSRIEPLRVDAQHKEGYDSRDRALASNAIDALPGVVANLWPAYQVAGSLLAKVVNEAQIADVLGGESPEYWSPLGMPRPETVGRLRADAELNAVLDEQDGLDASGRLVIGDARDGLLVPKISMLDDESDLLGSVVLSQFACVAPIPLATDELTISWHPSNYAEEAEYLAARAELTDDENSATHSDVRTILLWRCYFGTESNTTDGISENGERFTPAALTTTRAAGFIVIRAAHRLDKKTSRGDITWKRRYSSWRKQESDTVESCPNLDEVLIKSPAPTGHVVVAVHGTMSCGIPMARELRQILDSEIPIFRFEHDTWLPIADNGDDLAKLIRELDVEKVTLVAHSRGGLVACHAAARIARPEVQVVTLGTPFKGTPIASVGKFAVLGMRSLLGVARALSGNPFVDIATRFAGFFVAEVPAGIAAMRTDSDLSRHYHSPPSELVATVAGHVDSDHIDETMGCHFLVGGRGVFDGRQNDLVVSFDSARGNHEVCVLSAKDHFSYLSPPKVEVHDLIRSVVGPPNSPNRIDVRPAWWTDPRTKSEPEAVSDTRTLTW